MMSAAGLAALRFGYLAEKARQQGNKPLFSKNVNMAAMSTVLMVVFTIITKLSN